MSIATEAINYVRRGGHNFVENLGMPGPEIEVPQFSSETVSPGTAAIQLATALLSGFRSRANYRQKASETAARLAYLDAQTRLLESKLVPKAEEATQEYAIPGEPDRAPLRLTDPQAVAHLGQLFPREKSDELQRERLAISKRLADIAEARLQLAREREPSSRSRLGALSASARAVEGESKAGAALGETNAAKIAAGLVRTVQGWDAAGKEIPRPMQQRARLELGLPPLESRPVLTPTEISQAQKAWAARHGGAWAGEARERGKSRLATVNREIYTEAGLDFGEGSDIDALIQRLNSLAEE